MMLANFYMSGMMLVLRVSVMCDELYRCCIQFVLSVYYSVYTAYCVSSVSEYQSVECAFTFHVSMESYVSVMFCKMFCK